MCGWLGSGTDLQELMLGPEHLMGGLFKLRVLYLQVVSMSGDPNM